MAGLALSIQGSATVATAFGTDAIGPITVQGTITPYKTYANLLSGNNTIAVPSGAWAGCLIVPPTTNTQVLKAKTTSGDTGINIPKAAPSLLIFDSANLPTNLYLNAAADTTGLTAVMFF